VLSVGNCSPSEGALYPALREFEEGGYLTSESEVVSGRQRKVYTLTDKGRDAFRVGVDAWMEITDALVETKRITSAKRVGSKCAC
jgi:PadR family transcriptional regulator, regulatory protein PadR